MSNDIVKEYNDGVIVENNIRTYWKENNIVMNLFEQIKDRKPFEIRDGPPFATGNMHHGHGLVGVVKDAIVKAQIMLNRNPYINMGFDTHGLPIEQIVEKEYKISGRDDIAGFNKLCNDNILTCVDNWVYMTEMLGRFIDMQNMYKTCDIEFMNKIWEVFNILYSKKLIYKGCKIMAYSTGCKSVLSSFEAAQNYKRVKETFLYVSTPIIDSSWNIIIWTTTPWSLIDNMLVCVNPNMIYVVVDFDNKLYIVAETLINNVFKGAKFNIVQKMKGSELIGLKYYSFLPYHKNDSIYHIVADNYVTDKSGTGLVHIAPAYGQDDFRICIENNIIEKNGNGMFMSIDDEGKYTIPELKGLYIKDKNTEKQIIVELKTSNKLFKKEIGEHEYPYCYRTETPLIYRAAEGYFLDVQQIKDNLIENTKNINWCPSTVKNRFDNWIKNSSDWCISRSRYWGTPIPLLVSNDGDELCVSNKEELESLFGEKFTDIHLDKLLNKKITISNKEYTFVPYIFDCWFESGIVPYANDYNQKISEKQVPLDIVCESLDQQRGWFYTLNVLSTALFNKPAFKNVICTGIILAEDGSKMSKSKKNYKDPKEVISKKTMDALGFYLLTSPVIKSEPMRFNEQDIDNVVSTVIMRFVSCMSYMNIRREHFKFRNNRDISTELNFPEINENDNWLIKKYMDFKHNVIHAYQTYDLYEVCMLLSNIIKDVSLVYIKINADTLKGNNNEYECEKSLNIFIEVLRGITILLAPIMSFHSEHFYQLYFKRYDTVFLELFENLPNFNYDINMFNDINTLLLIVDDVRHVRGINGKNMKRLIKKMLLYVNDENERKYLDNDIILDKLKKLTNIEQIILYNELKMDSDMFKVKLYPRKKEIGELCRSDNKQVLESLRSLTNDDKLLFVQTKQINVLSYNLTNAHIDYEYVLNPELYKDHVYLENNGKTYILDMTENENIKDKYTIKLFVRMIQTIRKRMELQPWNPIKIKYMCDPEIDKIIKANMEYIVDIIKYPVIYEEINEQEECNENTLQYNDKEYKIKIVILLI